jgi:predicted transcriptional regulator
MTTNIKRVVAYHISRLRDKNPDVRLKSIQELAQLADEDALVALQQAFQTETDAAIKRAAQEAGRTVFTALKSARSGE